MFSVPLIAGCPGLVPGWRAFPAINRVPLPTPARPFSPHSRGAGNGARRDGRGSTVAIAYCSCIPCATPAQDRGSLKNAKQVLGGDRGGLSQTFTLPCCRV